MGADHRRLPERCNVTSASTVSSTEFFFVSPLFLIVREFGLTQKSQHDKHNLAEYGSIAQRRYGGIIIGVDGEEFKPRSILRKEAASATTAATARPQGGAQEEDSTYRLEIVWRNVLVFVYLHIAAVYGGYLMLTAAKWYPVAWAVWLHLYGGFGITGGAHRLWAHRSYKAKWPLRVIAAIAQTIAVQNDIFEWSRD